MVTLMTSTSEQELGVFSWTYRYLQAHLLGDNWFMLTPDHFLKPLTQPIVINLTCEPTTNIHLPLRALESAKVIERELCALVSNNRDTPWNQKKTLHAWSSPVRDKSSNKTLASEVKYFEVRESYFREKDTHFFLPGAPIW